MDSSKILEQLENVGLNGVLIIFLFGVYKLLVSRNFISKCGFLTVDFRSKELRQQELEYKHIVKMAELEVEKLKYSNGIIDDYHHSNENQGPSKSSSQGC